VVNTTLVFQRVWPTMPVAPSVPYAPVNGPPPRKLPAVPPSPSLNSRVERKFVGCMRMASGWRNDDPAVFASTRASDVALSSVLRRLYKFDGLAARAVEQADQLIRARTPQQLPLLLDAHRQGEPAVQVALNRRRVLEHLVTYWERRGDLLDRLDDLGHVDRRLGLRASLGHAGSAGRCGSLVDVADLAGGRRRLAENIADAQRLKQPRDDAGLILRRDRPATRTADGRLEHRALHQHML
jgi:hypothetical protein